MGGPIPRSVNLGQVEDLAINAFADTGLTRTSPILGETNDVIIADNARQLLESSLQPGSSILLNALMRHTREKKHNKTRNKNSVAGFSLAMPIGTMNPERERESIDTAYVYWTAIAEKLRGQGLVRPLRSNMDSWLQEQGYRYVERDAMVDSGYADSILRYYGQAVVERQVHNKWDIGTQLFVRVDLNRLP